MAICSAKISCETRLHDLILGAQLQRQVAQQAAADRRRSIPRRALLVRPSSRNEPAQALQGWTVALQDGFPAGALARPVSLTASSVSACFDAKKW